MVGISGSCSLHFDIERVVEEEYVPGQLRELSILTLWLLLLLLGVSIEVEGLQVGGWVRAGEERVVHGGGSGRRTRWPR